eukprot:852352-Prymnesium_polylepis.1
MAVDSQLSSRAARKSPVLVIKPGLKERTQTSAHRRLACAAAGRCVHHLGWPPLGRQRSTTATHLTRKEHVAKLGVVVSLGTAERRRTIDHDRPALSRTEARQVAERRTCRRVALHGAACRLWI